MISIVLTTVLTLMSPQTAGAPLPATPQGKHVAAWIAAFNSGDEKTFLAAQRGHLSASAAAKRSEAEHVRMYKRMRGDFGTIKVEEVLKADSAEIQFTTRTKDGAQGTFTFEFDARAPYGISGLGIDVRGGA